MTEGPNSYKDGDDSSSENNFYPAFTQVLSLPTSSLPSDPVFELKRKRVSFYHTEIMADVDSDCGGDGVGGICGN